VTGQPSYFRIQQGEPLPDIALHAPFRAVVIIESQYTSEWQDEVSDWLVNSGCLYMMAWGPRCSEWDDSVDYAMQKRFDFEEAPDESFVMTTWHNNESLEEVFWFAQFCAHDPYVELNSLIVHVSDTDRGAELLRRYAEAQDSV